MDAMFGTFRERKGRSQLYTGAATDIKPLGAAATTDIKPSATTDTNASARPDSTSKVTLQYQGIKTSGPRGFSCYMLLSCLMLLAPIVFPAVSQQPLDWSSARLVAALCAFGPILLAAVLMQVLGDKKSARWPFHKEEVIGKFGGHLFVGFMVGVLPAYHTVAALLSPETAQFHDVWFAKDGVVSFAGVLVAMVAVGSTFR